MLIPIAQSRMDWTMEPRASTMNPIGTAVSINKAGRGITHQAINRCEAFKRQRSPFGERSILLWKRRNAHF